MSEKSRRSEKNRRTKKNPHARNEWFSSLAWGFAISTSADARYRRLSRDATGQCKVRQVFWLALRPTSRGLPGPLAGRNRTRSSGVPIFAMETAGVRPRSQRRDRAGLPPASLLAPLNGENRTTLQCNLGFFYKKYSQAVNRMFLLRVRKIPDKKLDIFVVRTKNPCRSFFRSVLNIKKLFCPVFPGRSFERKRPVDIRH